MPEESADMSKTLIIHSEKDDVNGVINQNGLTENKNFLKLHKLNDVVRRFFDNTKASAKSSNAEKNDGKNSSIKELTYVMCKKLKQNILQNSNSNGITYNLVNEKTQKDPLIEELKEFSLKDYRKMKEDKRLLANKETKCCVRQNNPFKEELDEFDMKECYSVENNEQLLANKGVTFFESFENKETLEGFRMNDKDLINMQAAVVTDESSITEDLSLLGHFYANSIPESVETSANSSSESVYKIKGHNPSNGKNEIIYEESRYLRRRISVEYCDQDSEKAKSEYRIKEFLKTNLVNFASPRLLSGSAVIVNNDNTNVKFSTFKPDVKIVERIPIFERISKTDQLSGGQVVLEEFSDRFKYPNYYGEDSTIDDETSDTFYNYQPCFAKCTRQSKISTRYLSGGKVTDKSHAGISLPELYPARKLDLELNFPSPSVEEHLSGGYLRESFDVEHEISVDFLSKTITFGDDISSAVIPSLNNDGNFLAINYGCHNSDSDNYVNNQVNSNYFNTNRRRYRYSSDTNLTSSSTSIPSKDLYDLKSSKSNINKPKKSLFKAGLSFLTKKKSINRSVSEYSFNSWKTNIGGSNPKHNGRIPSGYSASVSQDLNIPKYLSRYSVDPRNSAESFISCRRNSISKTNSSPFI